MAKALLGHVGVGTDPRLLAEVRRLQLRVRDLEDEVARVRAANDVLTASLVVVDHAEHAYGEAGYDQGGYHKPEYDKDYQHALREPALA